MAWISGGRWLGSWIVDRWIGFGFNGEEEDREEEERQGRRKRALGTVWYNID